MAAPLPLQQGPETVQQEAEETHERDEPRMWTQVLAPTLLGLVASVLVMAANTNPGRWLPGSRQGPWLFSFPVLGSADVPNSVAIAVYYAGIALLGLAWVWVLRVATRRRPFPPALAFAIFLVWSAPLAVAPPVASDDLAAYAATGLLIDRGFDPYEVGVGVLGRERAVTATSPFWHDTPQPYGPVFLEVMATASSVTGHRYLRTVMVLRAFALVCVALLAVPLLSLARRCGRDPGLVLVSVICSPLALLHLVGGGHNEALMLLLLAAGLAAGLAGMAAATQGKRVALGLAGVALCGLGTGVKVPALLGAAVARPEATCKGASTAGFANGQIPTDVLCPLWGTSGQILRADAAASFNALSRKYAETFRAPICVTDSYRDYASQVAVRAAKPTLAAVPGTSNHGWGVAVDLCDGVQVFGSLQHEWLKQHAMAYGWFHPSWAQAGGSKPEPWHWEYAG